VFVRGNLDGEHVQIHKSTREVIHLSVSGRDVTTCLPDIAQPVLDSLATRSTILDAEVMAYDSANRHVLPFYKTFHNSARH